MRGFKALRLGSWNFVIVYGWLHLGVTLYFVEREKLVVQEGSYLIPFAATLFAGYYEFLGNQLGKGLRLGGGCRRNIKETENIGFSWTYLLGGIQ